MWLAEREGGLPPPADPCGEKRAVRAADPRPKNANNSETLFFLPIWSRLFLSFFLLWHFSLDNLTWQRQRCFHPGVMGGPLLGVSPQDAAINPQAGWETVQLAQPSLIHGMGYLFHNEPLGFFTLCMYSCLHAISYWNINLINLISFRTWTNKVPLIMHKDKHLKQAELRNKGRPGAINWLNQELQAALTLLKVWVKKKKCCCLSSANWWHHRCGQANRGTDLKGYLSSIIFQCCVTPAVYQQSDLNQWQYKMDHILQNKLFLDSNKTFWESCRHAHCGSRSGSEPGPDWDMLL